MNGKFMVPRGGSVILGGIGIGCAIAVMKGQDEIPPELLVSILVGMAALTGVIKSGTC